MPSEHPFFLSSKITIHRTIRWFFIFGHLSPRIPAAANRGRGTGQRSHPLMAIRKRIPLEVDRQLDGLAVLLELISDVLLDLLRVFAHRVHVVAPAPESACARGRGTPPPRGWRFPSTRRASGGWPRSLASSGRRTPSSGTSGRRRRGTYSSSTYALNLGCRMNSTYGSFQMVRWSAPS